MTVPEAASNPLGSVAEWIRVHRRGIPATPAPAGHRGGAQRGAHAARRDGARRRGAVAAGHRHWRRRRDRICAALLSCIVAAAAIQLRRTARNPALLREEPDTGTMERVESEPENVAFPATDVVSEDFHKLLYP